MSCYLCEIKSLISGNSSVDRALAFQAGGRGFEPRFPLSRCFSSVVERFLGKEEVPSSTLGSSSSLNLNKQIQRSFVFSLIDYSFKN